jgi:type IV secretion system protein TrbL
MMDHNILTNILTAFTQNASLGYARLVPDALRLIRYFIIFECVLFGVAMALNKSELQIEAIKKLFLISFFLWLIPNMQGVSNMIIKNAATAGIIAGGSVVSVADIFDPSAIVSLGIDATQPIFENGGVSLNIFNMIMTGIAGLIILFCYFYIAWQLFLSIIEFYIITVLSVILLPFGLFKPLSFLYEKSIAATFALAIRFMILAFIVCLSYKSLQTLKIPADHTFMDCLSVLIAAGTIAFLCNSGKNLAAIYFGGGGGMNSGLLGAVAAGVYGAAMRGKGTGGGIANLIKSALGSVTNKGNKSGGADPIRSATTAHVK